MTGWQVLEPPDLSAHRALVAALLAEHWEVPLPSGEQPPDTHALWREADRAQMVIIGGFEIEARAAVERMAWHVLRLAKEVEWFRSDSDKRNLAIEETIIHNALGWAVTSEEAQMAWADLFGEEDRLLSRAVPGEHDDLRAGWLAAWDHWADLV